jgi:3-oxoacyl-[acyl-carrier protein] reductase
MMNLALRDKGAIVTGGSKGIGRAVALGLAQEGVNVAICARGEEALRTTEAELQKHGVDVVALGCDVSEPAALAAFLETAHAQLGRVDILVNNASAFDLTDTEASWQASWETDVMAAVRAVWQVAPWMAAQGGGSIIHLSSIAGMEGGWAPAAAYAAGKAALVSHAKSQALALAAQKIRVNSIAPGSIEFAGGFFDQLKTGNRPFYDAVRASIAWGRYGTAEEVADVVLFLASARASWITGVCLRVDGGQYRANL